MRIVLADDHAIVRNGVRWALEGEGAGFEVVGEAEDGEGLLAVLGEVAADVVLLDIRMPGLGGLEVLPLLKERHPEVRVVILSMHDEPAFIRSAIERGAAGYLLKSAGIEELTRALEVVAAGKSYVQSTLTGSLLSEARATAADRPTPRGLEILGLVADGLTTHEIAQHLGIAEATVKSTLQQSFERLGVSSRAEAVAIALRRGLIE